MWGDRAEGAQRENWVLRIPKMALNSRAQALVHWSNKERMSHRAPMIALKRLREGKEDYTMIGKVYQGNC